MIRKLENLGIRGIANNWLYSYLDNRQQYVSIGNVSSVLLKTLCDVPQGSVLGPLLFILYINDIFNVSKLLKLILFADDTNLFRSSDNLQQLCREVSVELNKLNVWFKVNKLSLNVDKTNFYYFFPEKKRVPEVNIMIGNNRDSHDEISACHTLPNRGKPGEKSIVMRLTSRKTKIHLLKNSKKLHTPETETEPEKRVYINEHLTAKNANIGRELSVLSM